MEDDIIELLDCGEKYGTLFEFCPDAVVIHYNCTIIYANPEAVRLLEAEKTDSLIGRNAMDFVHPEYHDIVESRVEESYKKEIRVPLIEEKFMTFKGKIIEAEVSTSPFRYKDKICTIVFVRDITERKLMENELRRSEQKYKHLFNTLSDFVALQKYNKDKKEYAFAEINDAGCRRLEYTREELMQKSIIEITNGSYEEFLRFQEMIEQNGGCCIHYSNEVSKSGKIIPVEVNTIKFQLEGEDYLLSISRDISERMEAERRVVESELQYRTLIESFPYGIFIRSKNELIFANKKGVEYLGISLSDVMLNNESLNSFKMYPACRKKFKNNMKVLKETGYMPLNQIRLVKQADGTELDLEVSATKIDYNNEEAYLIITRDISEEKKTEELQKNVEEKTRLLNEVVEYERIRTEFFANISHELRTPINIILSTLQLFALKLDTFDDARLGKIKKYMDTMKQNCYRLIRLINNLIDATKIDSGYFEIELSNNNIVSIVEDITLSIAEYIENKGISIVFDTDVEEKIIACDPDKIERIILNLISNAVKFTEAGGEIFVSITDGQGSVKISIKDTGIGIPEDKQQSIFQRFVQVDKSLARNREGSGIGLSLVKSLVELHNGTIRLESQQGKGSEFIIELPLNIIKEEHEKTSNRHNIQGKIEKISVEFSDIYL